DGPNRIYARTSDSGTRINHHFCPTCGVTVCWTRETGSTRFGIPVGAFNDPSFPAPSVSVWEKRRYEWSPPLENVNHWDTQPPRSPLGRVPVRKTECRCATAWFAKHSPQQTRSAIPEDTMPDLLKSVEDGVMKLTLNRPDAMNALSRDMLGGFSEALEEAAG